MKKVLVVDDDEDILFVFKTFLSLHRYDVATTLSCEHGIETFYTFKPDLVFLDVNVGTSDGRIMCRNIKMQAEFEHIPVILISANRQLLVQYVDYRATSILEKPFDFPKVLKIIQSHLNK